MIPLLLPSSFFIFSWLVLISACFFLLFFFYLFEYNFCMIMKMMMWVCFDNLRWWFFSSLFYLSWKLLYFAVKAVIYFWAEIFFHEVILYSYAFDIFIYLMMRYFYSCGFLDGMDAGWGWFYLSITLSSHGRFVSNIFALLVCD